MMSGLGVKISFDQSQNHSCRTEQPHLYL
jgi:hypothetical protein